MAAGEGEVPGGDAEPDRCDGAGDGVVHVGQQVAVLVVDGDALPAGGVVLAELVDRARAAAGLEYIVDRCSRAVESMSGAGWPLARACHASMAARWSRSRGSAGSGAGSRPYAAWQLRSQRCGRGSGTGSPGVPGRSVRPSCAPMAGRRWGRKCRDRMVPEQIRSLPRRSSRTCKACRANMTTCF